MWVFELIVICPQRKTGGRGEQIDLEKQFRVTFNDNSEKIVLQFHLINKYRPQILLKTRKCGDCPRDVAPWQCLLTGVPAVSITILLLCLILVLAFVVVVVSVADGVA